VSWLLRDDEVLAAVETRRRGPAGSPQGALLIHGPALLQTFSNPVALDVAWCARSERDGRHGLEVRRIAVLRPRRVALPQVRPGCLLVAGAGSFERWQLRVGDRLELREV
jgi:hypothetical protein